MGRNFTKRTIAVVASLVLSTLLICLVAYEQTEISSLAARNDHLNEELDEISSLMNGTRLELSSLYEYYSVLLESYSNLSARLQSLESSVALLSEALGHLDTPIVFFDKSIYYPTQEVFWNQDAAVVPVATTILDKNANSYSITVRISSSCGCKEVQLHRIIHGVFSATAYVRWLGANQTMQEDSYLYARYGDRIVASYNSLTTATALFAFPKQSGEDGDYSYWKTWAFDPQGIPLVNYGGSIGLQYNPVFVGGYALANYQEYLNTGSASFREKFFDMADWLVETAHQNGNFSVWEYDFPWPWGGSNVTVPYVSGLAQGVGMSVLIRAYFLSGNSAYLEVGKSAMLSFGTEMDEGGVRYTDSDGVWYEELADEGGVSGKVLNGFLCALINLYEYYSGLNDTAGFRFFFEGANSLSRNMYRYDTGSWSYYDLLHHGLASLGYHKMHIEQLRIMYRLTNDETFLYYSDRFQSYLENRQ